MHSTRADFFPFLWVKGFKNGNAGYPEDLAECRRNYSGGTRGKINADGCSASCRMILVAETKPAPSFAYSTLFEGKANPVFRFRSNRGKLLLEISSRNTCPFLKTLLVAHKSRLSL